MLLRLLLGQTVKRSKTEHQIDRVDSDYRPILEQFSKYAESDPILGIVKGRNQHRGVTNIKVGIACREAKILEIKRGRHRQGHDLRSGAILEPDILNTLPIFRESSIVRVLLIAFLDEHERARIYGRS